MRRVAIVGSRDWPEYRRHEIADAVEALPHDSIVVTGGARGVDTWAEDAANACGLFVLVIKPNWRDLGRSAGMIRNSLIVEHCDEVIAFWNGASRGTMDTVSKALAAHKPVEIRR